MSSSNNSDVDVLSGFAVIMENAPTSTFSAWLIWALQHLNSEEKGRFLALVWAMWTVRNSRIFEEEPGNPNVVVMGFVSMVAEYQGYAKMVGERAGTEERAGESVWRPPAPDTIKINSDAAIFKDTEVGLGVVGRNSEGEVVMVASRRIQAGWSPEMAEAEAMLFGLDVASRLGMTSICMESDAVNVVRAVQKNVELRSPLGLCISDVCSMAKALNCKGVNHVKRGGNTVAHLAARLCSVADMELIYVNDFPPSVLRLAELDLL